MLHLVGPGAWYRAFRKLACLILKVPPFLLQVTTRTNLVGVVVETPLHQFGPILLFFYTKKSSTQMAHHMPFGSAHFFIISSALRLASKETAIQYLNQLLQNQSH